MGQKKCHSGKNIAGDLYSNTGDSGGGLYIHIYRYIFFMFCVKLFHSYLIIFSRTINPPKIMYKSTSLVYSAEDALAEIRAQNLVLIKVSETQRLSI